MGVGYLLVNHTRREQVRFAHLPASTATELAGNPIPAAVTTWYLIRHSGEQIAFVSDTYGDWPFPSGSPADVAGYPDVTDDIVTQLIEARILRDDGIAWADETEPQAVYMRALKNVWME